jgi:hypothetical protein
LKNAEYEVDFFFISGAGGDIPLRYRGARSLPFCGFVQEDFQTEVGVKGLVAEALQTCQSFYLEFF